MQTSPAKQQEKLVESLSSAMLPGGGTSLVAQLVKNPPTMQETWIQSLGWEDFLEKGTATHSSILNWRTSWTVYTWGSKESDTTEQLSQVRYRI